MFTINAEHIVTPIYQCHWVRYTTELAKEILDSHNSRNRSKKIRKIAKMASAMSEGKWVVTHQGIAFATDGTLLDGQNRLEAIVKSGMAQVIVTFFGLPQKAQTEMDTGSSRNATEALQLGLGLEVHHRIVGIAKSMMKMGVRVDVPNLELADFIADHRAAIDFTHDLFSRPLKGGTAGVFGCIARAFYTVDHHQLREFASIVKGEVSWSEEQRAAASFSRMLLGESEATLAATTGYAYCQRALIGFIHGIPLKIIKPLYGNYFPLPNEQRDELPRDLQKLIAEKSASVRAA